MEVVRGLEKTVKSGKGYSENNDKGSQSNTKLLFTENALKVLEKRYLRRDVTGQAVETPEDLFRRVAKNIAQADLRYDPDANLGEIEDMFYEMMISLDFLPNSPTLMNAGRELQQLSACFVLPVEDSMAGIFDAVKNTALIHQSGGGTGFSFSRLRPKNDPVSSTMGKASGPISFMSVFDSATETIKQGGTRRGANMAILRVDHPDILDFISCKEENDKLNNFNISVGMTADFMKAVFGDKEYDLISPRNKRPVGKLQARKVFDKIVEMAWKNGDPGIIFLDRINRDNPTPRIGEIEATNPCGEQPLLPYESCNLGSINLSKMISEGTNGSSGTKKVDYHKLGKIVNNAVHFLDNIIDMNRYPLPQIKEMTQANRKVGLGVMGWADMLIKLDIPYNSEDAIKLAEKVMGFIQEKSIEASGSLAKKRGLFPNYKGSLWEKREIEVRNATLTTIAPTGTISIIAGCSSGIEPLFAISFVRNVLDGEELVEVNPYFKEIAEKEGFYTPELMKYITEKGGIEDVEDVPESVRSTFVTSHVISPEWHIRMQTAFQKHTDNAVSKTVNFPNEATKEDVAEVYELAYFLGCKGVTVYRDGSRDVQVLNKGQGGINKNKNGDGHKSEQSGDQEPELSIRPPMPKARGEVTFGVTKKMNTGCGNLYITINEDEEGRPFEVFNQMGKAGGCAASQSEAIGRLISLALRGGIKPEVIVKQMKGICCHLPAWQNGGKILSCADGVAKALEWYGNYRSQVPQISMVSASKWSEGVNQTTAHVDTQKSLAVNARGACPDCGGVVEHVEGCITCRGCGYTECG